MSVKFNLLDLFQNDTNILNMFLLGVRVDQDVVEIGDVELIQELMKNVIDIGLE